MRTAWLFLLLLAGPALGQTIELPPTMTFDQPGLIVIQAKIVDCDSTRWWSHGGIQNFPPEILPSTPGTFIGFVMQPGVYKVAVVGAKAVNGKAVMSPVSTTVVTVGTPTPPTPPAPPTPTDPLAAQIQAAYAADPSPTKGADLHALAGVYTATAAQIAGITTANALFTVMQNATQGVIALRLPGVRGIVGTDLKTTTLPADGTATLTPAQQTAIAARLNYYASMLAGVK